MAATSLANFLSFFNTSKPPPPPTKLPASTHVSTTAPPSSSGNHPGLSPLILSNESQSSLSCSPDVMSVVCPSLAYANTMYFSSVYNVQIMVEDNEPEEKLLGRFRREVMRAGIIQECRRRMHHENKQEEKKRKAREAAKRNRRRRFMARNGFLDRLEEVPKDKKDEDDDDNWDLPDNLPY